jgi:transposase, IS5 family
MDIYQPSFFDESERLAALTKLKDPLEALAKYIDFELFREVLAMVFAREENQPGAKPYDPVLMFKILILQRLYKLSDPQAEFQITDRMSFTRFLGLRIGETIPDYSTIWRFREALTEAGVCKRLFDEFGAHLAARGVLSQEGVIVDASFVEVPRQRNSREENVLIKQGEVPEAWEDQPNKLAQKDVDARWTKKSQQNFYGYKDHVRTDAGSGVIVDYVVTHAAVHDSQVLRDLVTEKDRGLSLWADSAYKSAEIDAQLAQWGIENRIHEKGTSVRVLDETQKRHNREKSKIRCLIEHVFGFMENSMNGPELEYIGKARIATGIGLANLTYNLCRFVQLIRLGRVPAMA